jgi:hypothetical protein
MLTTAGHLTYCTNIHPGESWEKHFAAIRQHFLFIKNRLSPANALGIGLRLSHIASLDLVKEEQMNEFRSWLQDNNAYVFTMNGFPYGGFHHTRVKDHVHSPDWSTKERLEYTLRLFDVLSGLLPSGLDGGVSTSPLSYRHWFRKNAENTGLKKVATENILLVAEKLIRIRQTTGQLLHLDIEPEPDGIIESGPEFLEWFNEYLLAIGIPKISTTFGVPAGEAAELIKAHIGVCYDVCHFSVGYEKHAGIIHEFIQQGIRIGRIQISAALKAEFSGGKPGRPEIASAFAAFDEPTYLHQVVALTNEDTLIRYSDLPEALADAGNTLVKAWRAHFHVPVFEENFGVLQSTQSDITEVLELQKKLSFTQHLEVETYTWDVLPENLKLPSHESITRELEWVLSKL